MKKQVAKRESQERVKFKSLRWKNRWLWSVNILIK